VSQNAARDLLRFVRHAWVRDTAASDLHVILLLKNLLFIAVVPTLTIGWIPLRWLESRPAWPGQLAVQHYLGAAFVILGALAYLHCVWLFMQRGKGTPALFDPPRKLVQRGLYRWVRNPMYLAAPLILAGEACFLLSLPIAIYGVVLASIFQLIVVLHEESDLSFRFGAMYDDYRREVPRWFPRRPRNDVL